jgi:hypothetical protein
MLNGGGGGDETRTCADKDEDLGGRDPRLRRHAPPLSRLSGSTLDGLDGGGGGPAAPGTRRRKRAVRVRSFGKGKASAGREGRLDPGPEF